MLATSVWNLPSPWKGVERARIYLGVIGIGVAVYLSGIGVAVYLSMCPASDCNKLVGNGHLVTCYAPHGKQKVAAQYYICNAGERWAHGGCDQN